MNSMLIGFLFSLFYQIIYSAPTPVINEVIFLDYQYEPNIGDGDYYFTYETSDGSFRKESSKIEKDTDGTEFRVVEGSYMFISDDGMKYIVNYRADKNGYHVKKTPKPEVSTPVVKSINTEEMTGTGVGKRISSALLGSLVGSGIG